MNFGTFNLQEFVSAFIILFAVIDAVGSTPIIISLRESGKTVKAMKATWMSTLLLVAFFYVGDVMLKLFHVDIASFAVAGSLVIFLMAIEMLLDVEIFKFKGPSNEATLVPLVFPLIAGAGSFTTLLSLRADHAVVNIMIALVLNILFAFIVLASIDKIEKILGKATIFILRKFFGVILLALAVKMFVSNISTVIATINPQL